MCGGVASSSFMWVWHWVGSIVGVVLFVGGVWYEWSNAMCGRGMEWFFAVGVALGGVVYCIVIETGPVFLLYFKMLFKYSNTRFH